MGTVTTSLVEKARSIFTEMGYDVASNGRELRAERKWRTVRVTPVPDPDRPLRTDGGFEDSTADLRCFVTTAEHAPDLERYLDRTEPAFEWAVVGVDDDQDYEVLRAPVSS